MARFPAFQYKHVKHCSTHPKFLHSNSTSHRWAFGAIAELIDNAIDPDVNASQFCIDLREFNGEPCLVLMDNGCGLTPERLHKMLSFGHSKKQMTPGDRSIGKHGNGFKSGTMRLGRDVLVLTKCVVSMTAGFLSQTFLADVGAEDILIPLISWDLKGNRLSPRHADIEESLQAICNYSIFPDEASILAQLDAIPGTGTILIISNLRRHEGVLELDYKTDPHDIRITSEITSSHYQQIRPNQPNSTDVPTDYSLRAYVAILYKVPRMQIFIRDHKVRTKRIAGLLSQKEVETYKPMGVSETTKIELGFNSDNRNLYGMMLYHRNRLIKPYMRVGMQLEENEKGMGVLGVVEADFLQPTHNKQDFDDTTAYRRLLKKLADVLNEYWWEKKERLSLLSPQADFSNRRHSPNNISEEDIPDVIWVQCDNPSCLKWRILPDGTDPTSLPDTWYCEYHPDSKYRRHEEPEQEWDASVPHEIVERRKERKREYDRERKEREAQRRRQKLEALAKEDQKQKEAIRKEMEEKAALEQLRFEKERKEHEEQVQRLQKEVAEAQAFRDEMTRKHEELLKQLHGREEAAATKEFSSFPTMEENVVQVSEHEYSQTGSGEFSEETREVSASKTTSKMLIDLGRRDEISTLSKNQNETTNRAHLEIIVDDSPLCSQRDRSLQEDMMVCSSSAARSQEQGLHRQFDLEILQPTTMSSLPLNSDRHSKDLMSSSHFGKVFNESQLPSSSPAVITSFLPSAGSGARGNSSDTTYQSQSEMQKWPRPGRYPPAANNNYGMAQTTTSMSKGADVVGAAPTMPETPSPSCMPAFLTQYSRSAAAPQSSANTFTHHLLETSTNTNQGPTSVSLAGFQDSSLPPSELFEQGPMLMDNDEEDHRRPNQFAIIPTSNRNDIQRRVMSNASISGRINDPPNTNLATNILATQMPLECVGANGNSFGCETDLAPNKEVFSLQRRLRVALNTLLRIGGTMEANLMNFELPSTDMDVVTICEKTKNAVEMRWRTYEEEIAKLRAELAYTFSGNYRMGRSITDNWGAAIGIQK